MTGARPDEIGMICMLGFDAALCYQCMVHPEFRIANYAANWAIPEALLHRLYETGPPKIQGNNEVSWEELITQLTKQLPDAQVVQRALLVGYHLFTVFCSRTN